MRPPNPPLPTLQNLGTDLLGVTPLRLCLTLGLPFLATASYCLFAHVRWWPAAVGAVMVLSFVTYGSSSHDLVHRTLGLPRALNDVLLSLIEALSLRSGTAYRLSHLHHHAHLLAADDIEGSAAHGSLAGAIAAGFTMQPRLWLWAWSRHPTARPRLAVEALVVLAAIAASLVAQD